MSGLIHADKVISLHICLYFALAHKCITAISPSRGHNFDSHCISAIRKMGGGGGGLGLCNPPPSRHFSMDSRVPISIFWVTALTLRDEAVIFLCYCHTLRKVQGFSASMQYNFRSACPRRAGFLRPGRPDRRLLRVCAVPPGVNHGGRPCGCVTDKKRRREIRNVFFLHNMKAYLSTLCRHTSM